MTERTFRQGAFCVSMVLAFSLVGTSVCRGSLTNGDFSSGLSGWSVAPTGGGAVFAYGGKAHFLNPADDLLFPGAHLPEVSLSQSFSVADEPGMGIPQLHFDVILNSSGLGESDEFHVWITDLDTSLQTQIYTLNSGPIVGTYTESVMKNLSPWANSNISLTFVLANCDDGIITDVDLDNVSISRIATVPLQGALFLGLIGCLASVATLQKRRTR